MAYLKVISSNKTLTYPLESTANAPYLKVGNSFVPLSTRTTFDTYNYGSDTTVSTTSTYMKVGKNSNTYRVQTELTNAETSSSRESTSAYSGNGSYSTPFNVTTFQKWQATTYYFHSIRHTYTASGTTITTRYSDYTYTTSNPEYVDYTWASSEIHYTENRYQTNVGTVGCTSITTIYSQNATYRYSENVSNYSDVFRTVSSTISTQSKTTARTYTNYSPNFYTESIIQTTIYSYISRFATGIVTYTATSNSTTQSITVPLTRSSKYSSTTKYWR